jgi:hypothetical protein
MARRPRRWKENSAYAEVKRTVDRQFLLKPTPDIKNIIGASLGRALEKFPVKLYWAEGNVNHMQASRQPLPGKTDNCSKFDQMFYSLLSRGINKLWGRDGPVWSSRNRSTEVIDDQALEQQLFYAVTNMVKDGLLDKVSHSKGFSCYEALATGKTEKYWYTDWTGWWKGGGKRNKKPVSAYRKWVEVKYEPIPAWASMPEHKRQAHFRREVRKLEQEFREQRKGEGKRAMGPLKLARLDPRDRPKTLKEKTPQPLCHGSTEEGRQGFKEEWREFLDRYKWASGQYRSGKLDVEFPEGSFRPPLVTIVSATAL